MNRFLYGFWVISLGVITALTFVRTHPPHAAPPVAEVPRYANEVYPDLLAQVSDYIGWVEGVKRGEEEARQAEAARVEAARRAPSVRVAPAGDPTCAGFPDWFPHYIIMRESHCTRGIDTGNGYYGAYQVAGFHWSPGGACSDLTWTDPWQEDECTWRLSVGGTRLSPWGF